MKPTRDGVVPSDEKVYEISPERRIPIKQKDHVPVTIPCTIKDKTFKKVLINFGATVSLMPLSIFQKFGIGKVSEIGRNLKFADHPIKSHMSG